MMQNVLISKVHQFFKNITPKDKVAILHHSDSDGICSAVLAAKIVERIRNKRIDLRLNARRVTISHENIKELKNKKITKLITVDCSVEHDPEIIKEIEKFADILVIDHHKIYNKINSSKTVFIKPQMLNKKEDGSTYCVSKFLFDLSPIDISDLDWVSAVGLIGDMNHKRWKTFVNQVFRKYKLKQNKDIYKTILGKLAEFIDYAMILREQEAAFWKVYSAKNPIELLRLLKEYNILGKEINYWIKNYKKLAEFHPKQNLIFYEIEPKYPIKGFVVNNISQKHPHTTVIATQISGEETTLSARRQDYKVKMNDLLEKAIKGLQEADAGGHIPAAGASIRTKDLPEFKKKIIKILSRRT